LVTMFSSFVVAGPRRTDGTFVGEPWRPFGGDRVWSAVAPEIDDGGGTGPALVQARAIESPPSTSDAVPVTNAELSEAR
jgi:hypothetical protein